MKNFFYKLLPIVQLAGIFFGTALLMAAYELLKELYFGGKLTLWESHTITVIVTATFATLVAFFIRNLADNLVKEAQEAECKVTGIITHLFDAVIMIDERGIIETVNPAAEKMFGYSSDEIIGRNVNILMPEPYASEHDGYIRNYLITKIPKILGKNRREVLGMRANGEVFPIDLITSKMCINGHFEFIGIVRDMTDYKRAEDEVKRLRESETKMLEYLQHELETAGRVQASMLPSDFPLFPQYKEFDVFASMTPAKLIGGDFYDVLLVDTNKVFVAIGDVTGKGISAALHMVHCMADLRLLLLRDELQPDQILFELNNLLCENNSVGIFITLCCGILDFQTGEFVYSNAGHNPPLTNATTGYFEFMPMPKSIVLGFMKDAKYNSFSLQLNPGDSIFLYTDGVTEAENQKQDLFSDERLLELLAASEEVNAQKIIELVKAEIDAFAEGVDQSDDITMLTLHYLGASNSDI
ncbi:MAG: SpoIIE family protein phosphatase [Methylococcaceae bacterium]